MFKKQEIINNIKNEIKSRLNINLFNDLNSKKYLTYKTLELKCTEKITDNELIVPSLLVKDVEDLVKIKFNSLSKNRQITKINQLLYIPLILFNNIYKSPNEDQERLLYEDGYQLSKDLLTSVMSPYDLYNAKNILLENEIIKEIKWKENFYYSISNKKAKKYILNSKYKNLECKFIKNKYISKLSLLLKNKLAMRK